MIHGNVEETLDLLCMQIHCQHTARARGYEQIRDELRRDGHARLILAILAGVTVKRHDRRDALGARAPQCVNHDE